MGRQGGPLARAECTTLPAACVAEEVVALLLQAALHSPEQSTRLMGWKGACLASLLQPVGGAWCAGLGSQGCQFHVPWQT
ncbi:hypothetical protein HaLaN_27851 [Haematococcus lacustris]|uniref:Uncharacterized protein n=1 Tax=Haematococcus lacustris TaxID=44745 RepID=A0A6A0A915_HAELA|nr:hypothetical protein HaLaN_27851 [Haematococcus lacustris]